MLMRRANTGQPPRDDFAALGHELAKHAVVLVVNVLDFLDAELADFLTPEKLASDFAWRSTGAGTASETRAVAAGAISTRAVARTAFPRCVANWPVGPR